MFLDPIIEFEVQNEMNNLNSNKSPGYDGLSARTIKQVSNEVSKSLAHIFNLTFTTGIIPEQIKTSLVTPVFKSNEENRFENYRPISVLTCFAKLLEKLMYKQLIKYVEKNFFYLTINMDSEKNRSTELAIIELVNKITKEIDHRKYTMGIFLDLSKAFDTIDHKILISKLEYCMT